MGVPMLTETFSVLINQQSIAKYPSQYPYDTKAYKQPFSPCSIHVTLIVIKLFYVVWFNQIIVW